MRWHSAGPGALGAANVRCQTNWMPDKEQRWLCLRISGDNGPGGAEGLVGHRTGKALMGVWWNSHKGLKAELVLSLRTAVCSASTRGLR